MKYSKVIALSAITAALCVMLLVLGAYVELLDLSCIFVASVAMMIPVAKKYYAGAFLAYVAATLLGFLLTGARFQVIIPFAVFFGLHPIVNSLQKKYNINKILAGIIKTIWFVGTLFLCYYVTQLFFVENETVKKFINYILAIGGALFFIVYDALMFRFQQTVDALVVRLKL